MKYFQAGLFGVLISIFLYIGARFYLTTIELSEMTREYRDIIRIYRFFPKLSFTPAHKDLKA